jgi:hypothetical protein
VADRPLVAKLLAVEEYKAQYHDILQSAIDNFLENEKFSVRVTELSAMISPYVKADPTAFYSYEEYEQAVPQLISTNASQIENIQQQLDGTIASSGDGSGSGGGFGGMGGGRTGRAAAQGQSQAQAGAGAEPSAPTTSAADGAPGSDGAPAGQGGQPPQAGGNGAAGEAGGPPALPDGMQPPEGFTGDAGALGAAAEGAGEARPAGGFPGGDFPGGGRGLAPSAQPTGSRSEALATGIALLVLLAAAAFVAFFRRKRL